MASILVVSGKSSGYFFPLEEKTIVIGRDEGCEFQVLDEKVSRRHLRVRWDPQSKAFRADDLQSSNGVFVNGRQITEEVTLEDGDMILIGESKLFYTEKDYLDRDEAMIDFKKRGEHGKSTLIQ